MIRPERESDRARVFEIQSSAFGQTDEAKLVDVLRDSAQPFLSLVAEEDGELRGHVFFSPVTLESAPDAPPMAGLAPVAVDPAHQGRGLGSRLVRAGLEACVARGFEAVFLVGNPAYYARFGFSLAVPRGFTYGDPTFDPALQCCELRAGALEGRRGLVVFHPAFGQSSR